MKDSDNRPTKSPNIRVGTLLSHQPSPLALRSTTSMRMPSAVLFHLMEKQGIRAERGKQHTGGSRAWMDPVFVFGTIVKSCGKPSLRP